MSTCHRTSLQPQHRATWLTPHLMRALVVSGFWREFEVRGLPCACQLTILEQERCLAALWLRAGEMAASLAILDTMRFRACAQLHCSWRRRSRDAGHGVQGGVFRSPCDMRCRLIQRSRATVRMIHYFQRLSHALSWFGMSAIVSEVVSQVLHTQLNSLLFAFDATTRPLAAKKPACFRLIWTGKRYLQRNVT